MAFLLYLLQINIALSLLYLCYKVLFSQNTFFGLRRLILISIVLFSTTYPWYDIPDIDPIIPAHLQITLPEVLYSMEETVPQKAFDIYPLIAYLYGGICSLFLLRMFFENSFDNKTAGKWKAPYHRGEPYNRLRRKHTTLFLLPMDISSSFHFAK